MKTLSSVTTRRDRCLLFGRRAARLTPTQAYKAWWKLAEKLKEFGDKDVPKFNDLLIAIDTATRSSRMTHAAKQRWLENRKLEKVTP